MYNIMTNAILSARTHTHIYIYIYVYKLTLHGMAVLDEMLRERERHIHYTLKIRIIGISSGNEKREMWPRENGQCHGNLWCNFLGGERHIHP